MSGARCYSDHDEDLRTKGSCDYCGAVAVELCRCDYCESFCSCVEHERLRQR